MEWENIKKNRFNKQNKNSEAAAHFLADFFAFSAGLTLSNSIWSEWQCDRRFTLKRNHRFINSDRRDLDFIVGNTRKESYDLEPALPTQNNS